MSVPAPPSPSACRTLSSRPYCFRRDRQQYSSNSPAPAKAGSRTASPARFRNPPRPKSAAVRRPDHVTPPPPTVASVGPGGEKTEPVEGNKKARHTLSGSGDRAGQAPAPAAATATACAADDSALGRSEFRGSEHRGRVSSERRLQHRPRPRSAVARVETTPHHGKVCIWGVDLSDASLRSSCYLAKYREEWFEGFLSPVQRRFSEEKKQAET